MKPSIVTVSDIRAGYGGDDIINGVSFDVLNGEMLTIIGPNGSGKSTLIKALAGLVPARVGTISLFGEDVTALKAPQRIVKGLAYVPQEFNVFRNMTIEENLKLSTEFLGLRSADDQRARARTRDVSRYRRPPRSVGRKSQRRAAADARVCLCVDFIAGGLAAGRALGRPVAEAGVGDL